MSEILKNNEDTSEQPTGWENMDEYRKVNTKEYVEAGLADGSLKAFEAAKHARIGATKGEIGQEVISWSEDENGNPIQEKVATVTADEETGETGWIATKTDADGKPIVDKNGNLNQWIISDATFKKKYEVDPEHPEIFKPVGGPQKFVETRENLTISQWGEEMKIPRGSFINITNPDDMYAINPRDFEDTYSKIETKEDAPESTFDHRGREIINLDKIDLSAENGQMLFSEGYVNNMLNQAMTELEDSNSEKVDFKKIEAEGARDVEFGKDTLASKYALAEKGQRVLDDIRTEFLNSAALGEDEPYESIADALKAKIERVKFFTDHNYAPEIDAKAPEELLAALEKRLGSQ